MHMRMEAVLQQRPELRMKLAPQIIQSIEILQLCTLELQQRLETELLENPVLEMQELPVDEEEEDPAEEGPREERTKSDEEFERMRDIEESWRDYASQTVRRVVDTTEGDRKFEAMQNTAARPESLQDYLFDQYTLLELPDDSLLRIAENIVYNIDEDGYLQYDLEEVIESMDQPATLEEAERALAIIQRLDPPGVGARTLGECLLLQMRYDPEGHDLARLLITDHLEDLYMNRLPKIAKATGTTLEQIKEAAEYIGHLNPRPGLAFSSEISPYVVPDIIVEYVEGQYEVRLSDGTEVPAKVVLKDVDLDLAFVQPDATSEEAEDAENIKR